MSVIPKILIVYAHPYPNKSIVNKQLIQSAQQIPNVFIDDLYEKYPDFHINREKEQELLKKHDVIAFQFPLYWYSSPAILKEWQDVVLEYGFAYGKEGTALQGKECLLVITAGQSRLSYSKEKNSDKFTIYEITLPFQLMAKRCGMVWRGPFTIYNASQLTQESVSRVGEKYFYFLKHYRLKQYGTFAII